MTAGVLLEGTMELVAMELKQSGYFLARTLSYEVCDLLLPCASTAHRQSALVTHGPKKKGLHVSRGLQGASSCRV